MLKVLTVNRKAGVRSEKKFQVSPAGDNRASWSHSGIRISFWRNVADISMRRVRTFDSFGTFQPELYCVWGSFFVSRNCSHAPSCSASPTINSSTKRTMGSLQLLSGGV